jgi:peptidyl-tRNA hydrolase, PTH1 family
MEQATWLIAGLGNPGQGYQHNWHNSGFMVLDILAQRHHITISKRRCHGLIGQGPISGQRCILLKPATYMNLSGQSIQAALSFFKIPAALCLVIYDDVDIPAGQIRIRESGGPGTHNGMRSVIGQLGREDFPRIRIGIGPQPEHLDIVDYVLSDIPDEIREPFHQALNRAADAVETILGEGLPKAMNLFNHK